MKILIVILLALTWHGCASYEQFEKDNRDLRIPNQVFLADYQTTWAAAVSVLSQYDIEEQNFDSGMIRTRWIENTRQINFSDAFSTDDHVQNARFKLIVNVSKNNRGGKEVGRVSIFKRQVVERDFLAGWSQGHNDQILEQTLLYRIGRVIRIEQDIEDLQKRKETEEIDAFITN